ncbi:hypothetical protein [Desulfitobacterium metallireducens]|uniref:Uncharacterized protein n=1 Tax=Desulfitobacterium metallireducens DSM 15288 TaxID=871968 RepID=W0EGQ5_9FIRM|nr:hypothetical protein [Desulfitobacterium metallireducens]AHF08384.1 hypothetical protein DESME_01630 [Desulfitobacterium metallireducens DSM 15288]
MIIPKNVKKHLRIYCTVGLMTLTTLSIGELTRPSYALITSTSQTSISFSAAASFPQKEVIVPVQELAPSQTSEQPNEGAVEEQNLETETTIVDAQVSINHDGENPNSMELSQETESEINQTTTEGAIN